MTDSKPSKSARKRQFAEQQRLGETLIGLTDAQLLTMVTEPALIDAIREARNINSHGAMRRQKQLIGKIMRDIDPQPIQIAIEALGRQSSDENRIFREAEQWRERLCGDPAGGMADFESMTGSGSETLRLLLENYTRATGDILRKTLHRQIFREIHAELHSRMQSTGR